MWRVFGRRSSQDGVAGGEPGESPPRGDGGEARWLRILFVSSSGRLGGGNRFLIDTAGELQRRGHSVVVVFLREGRAVVEARRSNLEVMTRQVSAPDRAEPWRSAVGVARSMRILRGWAPDVVHANDVGAARTVALAARWLRIPVVCHLHGVKLTTAEWRWAFARLPAPATAVDVSQTDFEANERVLNEVGYRTRHVLLRLGIDLEVFAAKRKGARPGVRVGCVSDLVPGKRLHDFLDMGSRLVAGRPDLQLLIAGDQTIDPEYASLLHRRAEHEPLKGRVHFLGRRADVAGFLRELDVFVHCSEREGGPLAVMEALACGVPSVVTDIGDVARRMEDGVHGFVIPPGSPDLMATRVERLLEDPEEAQRIADQGRRLVERDFSLRRMVESLVEIYEDALARRIQPPS